MVGHRRTHAIDLVCRFLIDPGDVVLVDDPSYFNFRALLRAHRARVIGVPLTRSGPDVDAFAQTLLDHRPRLYLTNSAIHNPTGARLTAARLAACNGLNHVIRVGSFSKSVSSSIRCGHIVATWNTSGDVYTRRWLAPSNA